MVLINNYYRFRYKSLTAGSIVILSIQCIYKEGNRITRYDNFFYRPNSDKFLIRN